MTGESLWLKLNPGAPLLVLSYLRKGETFVELVAGFGIRRTTACRYANEVVEAVAARGLKPRTAVQDAKRAGYAYVILDDLASTRIRIGRGRCGRAGRPRCGRCRLGDVELESHPAVMTLDLEVA
jgi:hypothetical protein